MHDEADRALRSGGTLADVIARVLDRGLVINADIAVSVAGVELLGVKIRAALASYAPERPWCLGPLARVVL